MRQDKTKKKCMCLWGWPTSSSALTQQEPINSNKESKRCQRQGSEMTAAAFVFFILFTWMASSNALLTVFQQCCDFELCERTEGKRSQNAFTQFTRHEKAAVHHKAPLKEERWVKLLVNYIFRANVSWIVCFSGPAQYLVHILGLGTWTRHFFLILLTISFFNTFFLLCSKNIFIFFFIFYFNFFRRHRILFISQHFFWILVSFSSPNQGSSQKQMFKSGVSSSKAKTLMCNLVDSHVNNLQGQKESKYGDDGKWLLQKFLVTSRSFLATQVSSEMNLCPIYCAHRLLTYVFFFMQIKTEAELNDSTISTSVVPMGFGSYDLQVKHSLLTTL